MGVELILGSVVIAMLVFAVALKAHGDVAKARGQADWPFVFATLAVLALTLVVGLFFFRNTLSRDCGLCDDAASSVSQAPGP